MFLFKNYFHCSGICVHMCHVVQHLQKYYKSESNLKCLPSFQGSIRESRNVKIQKMRGFFGGPPYIAQLKKYKKFE